MFRATFQFSIYPIIHFMCINAKEINSILRQLILKWLCIIGIRFTLHPHALPILQIISALAHVAMHWYIAYWMSVLEWYLVYFTNDFIHNRNTKDILHEVKKINFSWISWSDLDVAAKQRFEECWWKIFRIDYTSVNTNYYKLKLWKFYLQIFYMWICRLDN